MHASGDPKEDEMREFIDIVYCSNNGVTALKPVPNSRLDKLVRRMALPQRELEQVWLFADPTTWRDEYGNDRTDHRRRGVVCGTHDEGHEFRDRCRRLGLTVEYRDFFVPCSNGQFRYGSFADGKPFADYPDDELRFLRYDLPTEETLRELIAESMVDTTASDSDWP